MTSSIGASYYLLIYTPTWVSLGIVTRFRQLRLVRSVNAPGELRLVLGISDLGFARTSLTRDCRVDVIRSTPGQDGALETDTIWFVTQVAYQPADQEIEITASAAITLLARREVAAAPGTAAADKTGAADSVLMAYLNEQIGPGAGARQMANLSLLAAAGSGPTLAIEGGRKNLLRVCQDICASSLQAGTPLYLDVIYDRAADRMVARTYLGQRGTDRSSSSASPLVFSEERNNLTDATVTDDWRGEITAVYALGAGTGVDQAVAERVSSRAGATPYSRVETTISASSSKEMATLQAAGDTALWKNRPRRTITGTAQNSEQCQYGVHWRWGDRVQVEVDSIAYDSRIDTIEIDVQNGVERITGRFRTEVAL
jgi:hypothetical protein